MTNKLPEVGKEYFFKLDGQRYEVIYVSYGVQTLEGPAYDIVELKGLTTFYQLEDFWNLFEELPGSTTDTINQLGKTIERTKELVEERGSAIKENYNCGLGDKVEKAKENLKKAIRESYIDCPKYHAGRRYIELAAQNLIDALDKCNIPEKRGCGIAEYTAKNAKDWKDVYFDVANAVKDKIKKEEMDILFGKNQEETKKKSEEEKIINCGICPASGEKDGIHFCSEEEKPQSIWKDVSELPSNGQEVFVKFKNTNSIKICAIWDNDFKEIGNRFTKDAHYLLSEVKEWCYLTDFINHIENIEERLRKLEGNSLSPQKLK